MVFPIAFSVVDSPEFLDSYRPEEGHFMHVLFRFLIVVAALSFAAPALAADTGNQSIPDRPARVAERSTPVAVEFEGTDSIGSRLSTRIKESLNASNLFVLTEKDTPKIRILVSTVAEFPDRPGVGSAYSVIWLFSQSESTLRHFLSREVGVLTPDDVDGLAARIIERTDGIAVRYGYLFQ